MAKETSKQAAAIAEKSKHPVDSMRIEPSDNGGFVSHTAMKAPARKPNGPYTERPDADTQTHANVNQLLAHVKATMGQGQSGKPPAAKTPSEWSGTANQMLASGIGAPKSSNGGL